MKRIGSGALVAVVLAAGVQLAMITATAPNPASATPAPSGWQTVPAANANSAFPGDPPVANGGLSSVSCTDDACMAVGNHNAVVNGFTTDQAEAEHETGGAWSLTPPAQPGGEFGDQLLGVSCASDDNCVAVGNQGGGVFGGNTPLAERWTGDDFEGVQTQLPGDDGSNLQAVSCSAVNQCMAVGNEIDGATDSEVDNGVAQQFSPAAGNYVDPTNGASVNAQQPSSKDGAFTATYTDEVNGVFTITVHKLNVTNPVVETQGQLGAFSANGKAFVTETLVDDKLSVQLFNLGNSPNSDGSPFTPIWSIDPTVASGRVQFSPGGNYLMVGYTTATQIFFDVASTTAVNEQSEQPFTSGGIAPVSAPGDCGTGDDTKCGTATYGFGPDDSRFMYSYVGAGGQQVQWRWTDLAKPAPQPTYSLRTDGTSGFAQFSPGGGYLAIVTGTGSSAATVELFATNGGADVGSAGPVSGASGVSLHATSDEEIATISGDDHDLSSNNDLTWTTETMPKPSVSAPTGVTGGKYQGDFFSAISCVDPADCTASGSDLYEGLKNTTATFYGGPLIEHWDGSAWTIVYSPASSALNLGIGDDGISCVGDGTLQDACVVTGFGNTASEILRHAPGDPLTTWKLTAGPKHPAGADYGLADVSCTSSTDCTAAGSYRAGGTSGSNATYVIHYDGTGWSLQTAPSYDTLGSSLYLAGVSCPQAGVCVAVGTGPAASLNNDGAGTSIGAFIISEGQGWDTGMTASPSTTDYGDAVTYAVTIRGPGAGGTPSGEIAVGDLCTAQLRDGVGSCTSTATPPGDAGQVGYLLFNTGQGSDAELSGGWETTVDISKATVTAQASISPTTAIVGDSVSYSVALSAENNLPVNGTVNFSIGSTKICSAQVSSNAATCAASNAPIGQDTVTASYAGSVDLAAATGTTSLTVDPAPDATATTTVATVSPTAVNAHHTVTYAATVTGAGGTPSGAVDFSDGDIELCAATLSAGAGSCHSNAAPVGSDTITASYGGDPTYAASSGTVPLEVDSSGTVPRIFVANGGASTITSYASTFAGNARPASTISSNASTGLNDPTATAMDGAGNLWATNCSSDSVVEYAVTDLETSDATPPTATLRDDGAGDLDCPQAEAFDNSGDLWVANLNTNTVVEFSAAQLGTLSTSPTPTPAVVLSDNSTGAEVDGTPTDTLLEPQGIAFDGNNDLWVSTGNGWVTEFTPSQLVTGSPAATVTRNNLFGGDITFDSSGDLWISETGNDSLVEYVPSQLTNGDGSQPTVDLSDSSAGDVAQPAAIQFDSEGDLWVAAIGSEALDEFSPDQLDSSGAPDPAEVIEGSVTGLDGPDGLAVQDASASSGGANATPGSVTSGDQVTYSATVSGSGGTPTGTVRFHTGSTALCTATLSGGTGSCTSSGAPIGSDTIAAIYSGDPTFAGAILDSASLQVGPPPSTPTLSFTPSSVAAGRNLLFDVAVAGPDGDQDTPTGTVTIHASSDQLCVATLSNGSGQCAGIAPTSAGATQIDADYSGDANFAASSGNKSLDVLPRASIGNDLVAGDLGGNALDTFDPTAASGDALPETTIQADANDDLDGPNEFAVDSHGDLWVSNCNSNEVASYLPSAFDESGDPTPSTVITGSLSCPQGLAFDAAGNLWVAEQTSAKLVEFSASEIAGSGAPDPITTIRDDGNSDLVDPQGLAISPSGALWVGSTVYGALLGYTAQQLAAGGTPTPTVITDGGDGVLVEPDEVSFDKQGNLWAADGYTNDLLAFSKSQQAAGGAINPSIAISDDGNGTLYQPGQLAFAADNSAWVGTGNGEILHYSAAQLDSSGAPTPAGAITNGLDEFSRLGGMVILGTPSSSGQPTVPTPPRAPAAVAGKRTVTVSWTAPASNGGAAVSGYQVRHSTNGTTWSTGVATAATHLIITGLSPGKKYFFDVIAKNSAGSSTPSAAVSATPYTTPGVPRSVRGRAGKKQITLTWKVPASNGGSAVTGYIVEYASCTLGSHGCVAHSKSVTVTKAVLAHLHGGKRYHLAVRAKNKAGDGVFTKPVTVKARS